MDFPPEAEWVTRMREHRARTGAYRQADIDRLLGSPWRSAKIGPDGNFILFEEPKP